MHNAAIQIGHLRLTDNQWPFTFGEVSDYNPVDHTVKCYLPAYPDQANPTARGIETGFLPVGTPYTLAGGGVQFPIATGMQCLVIFIAPNVPCAAVFLFNDIESPPFPDGKTGGFKNAQGCTVTVTVDGPTPGDGLGGSHIQGSAYSTVTTAGGHSYEQNDTAKRIIQQSTGGHIDLMDDLNKAFKRISAGGHSSVMDDIAQRIIQQSTGGHIDLMDDLNKAFKRISAGGHSSVMDDLGHTFNDATAGGIQTVRSDVTSELSHIAPHIGLGGLMASMTATTNAALNQSHLTTFESNLWTARRNDLIALINAMIAASVPNAGAILAQLAALAHVGVPNGSSVVMIKS